mgnify:CR=1 FL=1
MLERKWVQQLIVKFLKKIADWIDPSYWADKIGDKTGAYDKANDSSLAEWSRNLTGWKWWAWQLLGGFIGLIIIEILLNMIGMTIIPW